MANLFRKQAQNYVQTRPTYPSQLFDFIASKTPRHDLVWDVGTGNGQAAASLAKIYKRVIATDTSPEQLKMAPKIPNIDYIRTPPKLTLNELIDQVAPPCSVDLVTVAQAIHWFDLQAFYQNVNAVLTKPDGVLAVWCYTEPRVDSSVDPLFWRIYRSAFWAPERRLVEEAYVGIEFPFESVDGESNTGPFEFETMRSMDLKDYVAYIRSWSSYQTAKDRGVEILTDVILGELEKAWGGDGEVVKQVKFPLFLRIGKVRG